MARLQRVVWEGHGARLLSEVSSQPIVRKFLEAVPYIMVRYYASDDVTTSEYGATVGTWRGFCTVPNIAFECVFSNGHAGCVKNHIRS